jgi:hypothetical protein
MTKDPLGHQWVICQRPQYRVWLCSRCGATEVETYLHGPVDFNSNVRVPCDEHIVRAVMES